MASLVVEDVDFSEDVGNGPRVQCQSRLRFRRPATGVSGHESLSESDESLFSPVRGPFGRGEDSREAKFEVEDDSTGDEETKGEDASDVEDGVERDSEIEEDEDPELGGAFASTEERVEVDPVDSISECARVNFTVLISSSSGVRKETRFSAGKRGRAEFIFRGMSCRVGPLDNMEARLCGCL